MPFFSVGSCDSAFEGLLLRCYRSSAFSLFHPLRVQMYSKRTVFRGIYFVVLASIIFERGHGKKATRRVVQDLADIR
jgi:hypothetical protein